MNRLSATVLIAATVLTGCNRQPTTQVQTPSQPTNAISASPINAADKESGRQANAQVSDLFKSQLIKLVEEATKLDQLVAQGVGHAEVKSQFAATKAPFELARLTWPVGFATNALSNFDDAIRAWEFAMDLSEREQKMHAEKKDVLSKHFNSEEMVLLLSVTERAYTPIDLEKDSNGYQDLVGFGKKELICWMYPNDFVLKYCRGKSYLPLSENIKVLLGIASTRLKNAREEVLRILK